MPITEVELSTPERRRAGDAPDRGWPPPVPPVPHDGEGEPEPAPDWPPFSNARLGMLLLLGGESVFFGGLVAAFLQLRLGAAVWPPPGQPRLPLGLTAVNTVMLLLSSVAFVQALRAIRTDDRAGLVRWLALTGGLGGLFLAIQGV